MKTTLDKVLFVEKIAYMLKHVPLSLYPRARSRRIHKRKRFRF